MRKHPEVKKLKIGDELLFNPAMFNFIRDSYEQSGIIISIKDKVKFADVSSRDPKNLRITVQGIISEGGFKPERFFVPEKKDKEQQLLEKIDSLWKKQHWYSVCHTSSK